MELWMFPVLVSLRMREQLWTCSNGSMVNSNAAANMGSGRMVVSCICHFVNECICLTNSVELSTTREATGCGATR
jgi:hypothetical protein